MPEGLRNPTDGQRAQKNALKLRLLKISTENQISKLLTKLGEMWPPLISFKMFFSLPVLFKPFLDSSRM